MVNNNIAKVNGEDTAFSEMYGEVPTLSVDELSKLYGWAPEHEDFKVSEEEDNLSNNPELGLNVYLKRFQRTHSIINYSGKTFVCWRNAKDELQFQSINDFKNYNKNIWFKLEVDGKEKRVFVSDNFLMDKHTKHYQGLEFAPSGNHPDFLNLWKGWKVAAKQGDVSIFLELVDALCDSDEGSVKYMLDYLAHMVQIPEKKPEVAIVMRGPQGIGKGSLMKVIARLTENFKAITSSNSLAGQFSGHLMDAFVVFADESVWGGDKQAEGRLKALITEEFVSIRALHKDEIQVRSYHRLFFASNEDWAVPVGEQDRRYFVVDCSPRYKDQTAPGQFFHRFNNWLENGGTEAVLHFLLHRDISEFNPRVFPKTQARVDLQIRSLGTSTRFIYELLSSGGVVSEDTTTYHGAELRFSRNKLYEDLINWCNIHKKYPPTQDDFSKAISKALGFADDDPKWRTSWCKKVGGKNEYQYRIKSMGHAQQRFAQNIIGAPPKMVFFNYEPPKIFPKR